MTYNYMEISELPRIIASLYYRLDGAPTMYIGATRALFRASLFAHPSHTPAFVPIMNSHVVVKKHTNMYSKSLRATPNAPPTPFLPITCTILYYFVSSSAR